MKSVPSKVVGLISRLTGREPQNLSALKVDPDGLLHPSGIGLSQFNELLLLLGFDRINDVFFQFLIDGSTNYKPGAAFSSIEQLRDGVERFLKVAMLRRGNIKYAFDNFSNMSAESFEFETLIFTEIPVSSFALRHDPLCPIEPIAGEEAYYLGYIVDADINRRLQADPADKKALEEKDKRKELVEKGVRNHEAYLSSDHMDVYVATSMRERHEFYAVNYLTRAIFNNAKLRPLKIRYFDPTQAYCHDRIDKGLSEALMLKRAECTLYFAQETDTLGKDSELASTLAQGKPVIAYVPQIDAKNEGKFLDWLLKAASTLYPDVPLGDLLLRQLQVFAPQQAWTDPTTQKWVQNPKSIVESEAKKKLIRAIKDHYDKRASTLKESHPLGIQVHLETGVANGVLVARRTSECAELIHRILTHSLEFDIEEKDINGKQYLLLRERVSKSVFRVVSGDALLTKTFWNFYLK